MSDPPTRPLVVLRPESRRKLARLFMRLSRVPIDGVTGLPLTPGTGGVGGTSPGMAAGSGGTGETGGAVQNEGAQLVPRRWLNFIGSLINAADDSVNDRINVTVTDPVPAHEAASNPHPTYATDADLTAHATASDPHTQYAETANNLSDLADPAAARANLGVVQGHAVEDEGTPVTQRATINFTGAGVTVSDVGSKTTVDVPGAGGGHAIADEGSALTARPTLNFTGAGVTATDDAGNNRTNVTIPGGAGADEQAKVSANDTTPGYLNGKLVAGTNVTLTENNDGGNETLTIAAAGGGGGSTSQTAYGSRPAPGTAGDLHFPTDSFQIGRDDGAAWDHYGPIFQFTRPPLASSGIWVNQGSATLADDVGGLLLSVPAGAGNNLRGSVLATLPAEPWAVVACFYPIHLVVNFSSSGIFLREDATGKLTNWVFTISGSAILLAGKYNSPTSYSANYATAVVPQTGPLWLRIRNDATNRHYEWSPDGRNWVTVFSVAKNDFATTAYDQAGIHAEAVNATYGAKALYLSWAVA